MFVNQNQSGIAPYTVFQQDEHGQVTYAGQTYPAGGPYQLGKTSPVFVGELWVLAGQSNMEGVGLLSDPLESPHPQVMVYDMDESWRPAAEPLHNLGNSPRLVYHDGVPLLQPGERRLGAGLGLTFARERVGQTGAPVGLIPCARGGTAMARWSPAHREDTQGSLYGATLDRIRLCGGKVSGVLWYQGESDADHGTWPNYSQNMDGFLSALRADLGQPDLPFLMVQIGAFDTLPTPDLTAGRNAVREQQRLWSAQQKQVELVTTVDLALVDPLHVDTAGLQRLGRRLARASQGHGGLRPGAITWEETPYGWQGLRLHISGVQGALQAPGKPLGFSLRDWAGNDLHLIFRVELAGDSVLHVDNFRPLPDEMWLWYGYGVAPQCNVSDAQDSALVAFGPLAIPARAVPS